MLLVPLPAAEIPVVAGEEEYAYPKGWQPRLRQHPAVPLGHFLVLFYDGGVDPFLSLTPVGPATAPVDLSIVNARR